MPTDNFTTAGTTTWTCPAGVFSAVVEAIGGGEGGQPGALLAARPGGGAGAGARSVVTVVPGTSYQVVVGAGGAAGAMGANPVPGSASRFETLVVAAGGGTSAPNQGGQASASTGQTTISGGNGSQPPGGGVGGPGGNAPTIGSLVGGTGGNASTSAPGNPPGGGGQGGRADGNGASAAGASGAVRILYTPETNAPAGTINHATNPSYENNITGVTAVNGNVTRGTNGGYAGAAYARHTATSTGSVNRLQETYTGLTPGSTYTFVFFHRTGTTTAASVALRIQTVATTNATTNFDSSGVVLPATGAWTAVTRTVTLPANTASVRVISISNMSVGAIIDRDALLIVSGSTAYGYFDGDQINSTWTGTPHASTSKYKNTNPSGFHEYNGTSEAKLNVFEFNGTSESAIRVYYFDGNTETLL